jgi:antitoxin ParD1/3/4
LLLDGLNQKSGFFPQPDRPYFMLAKLANFHYSCSRGTLMPTRNVNLTPELDGFIATKVEAGLYANASEVMRAALRLLERDEREQEEKIAVLRAAIDKGVASGVAKPGVFTRVRKKYALPPRKA